MNNLTATTGCNSITVTWEEPTDGDGLILSYRIHIVEDGVIVSVPAIMMFDVAPTAITTNLRAGALYEVTAVAANAAGLGRTSVSVDVTTPSMLY